MKLRMILSIAGILAAQPTLGDLAGSRIESLSSKEVGNGGDVVVCRDQAGAIQWIELLDYSEARAIRKMSVDLGAESLTVDEKLELAMSRLEKEDARRASIYREWLKNFDNEASYLSGIELTDISDSSHIAVLKGCKVEQIAVQVNPRFKEDSRYTINLELWSRLSNTDKAGLKLHEVIYRDMVNQMPEELRHLNSIATRYFNSMIAADGLKKLKTPREKVELYQSLPLASVFVQGITLDLARKVDFYDSGKVASAKALEGSTAEILGQQVTLRESSVSFHENGAFKSFGESGVSDFSAVMLGKKMDFLGFKLELHDNGRLASAFLKTPMQIESEIFDLKLGSSIQDIYPGSSIRFYPDGSLMQAGLEYPYQNRVKVNGQWLRVRSSYIYLHENGVPSIFSLREDEALLSVGEERVWFTGDTKLHSNGSVEESTLSRDYQFSMQGKRYNCKAGSRVRFDKYGDPTFLGSWCKSP